MIIINIIIIYYEYLFLFYYKKYFNYCYSSAALSANSSARLLDDESREALLGPTSTSHGQQQLANSCRVTLYDGIPSPSSPHTPAAGGGGTRSYAKHCDNKFVSEEAWWDSRGLQPGKPL